MPQYLFKSATSDEVTELFYSMKDVPKVGATIKHAGQKWKRIFVVPQMSVDTKIDAFSQKEFREKTFGKKGETMGSMWDRSAELSEKRADKIGAEDPVREKYFKDYRKKNRKGISHLTEMNQNYKKAQKELANVVKAAAAKMGIE